MQKIDLIFKIFALLCIITLIGCFGKKTDSLPILHQIKRPLYDSLIAIDINQTILMPCSKMSRHFEKSIFIRTDFDGNIGTGPFLEVGLLHGEIYLGASEKSTKCQEINYQKVKFDFDEKWQWLNNLNLIQEKNSLILDDHNVFVFLNDISWLSTKYISFKDATSNNGFYKEKIIIWQLINQLSSMLKNSPSVDTLRQRSGNILLMEKSRLNTTAN